MFLEFDCVCVCGGGLFSKFASTNPFRPQYFGPSPKFRILLPTLFSPGTKVSKKICHTHERQKLRDKTDFLETDVFWSWAYLDTPGQILLICTELNQSWKFRQDPFDPSKVIQLFSRTDTCPPHPYRDGQNLLYGSLIPFTSLCLLCSCHSRRLIMYCADFHTWTIFFQVS